jgi:hypothetical protein
MDDIIVIDNVISNQYSRYIEREIMGDPEFPWYYNGSITHSATSQLEDSFGLVHAFWKRDSKSISYMTNLLIPLLFEACSKGGINEFELLHGRIFQLLPSNTNKKHHLFHTDLEEPHMVVLYYINDSDGETIISNLSYDDISAEEINKKENYPTVFKKVEPQKGRVVIFNGKYYHAPTNPSKNRRCIINFDIKVKS